MMKIKSWSVGLNANLIDGGTYTKHFYSEFCDKEMTIEELIKWLENFKENIIIIKEVEK